MNACTSAMALAPPPANDEFTMDRLIAGARPTGILHIGHYFGMLDGFVRRIRSPDVDPFFVIADLHMFTTNARRDSTDRVPGHIRELIVDCISSGVDPERVAIYIQSDVLEQAQIYSIVQSLVPHTPLLDQPSYRSTVGSVLSAPSLGFLGYPVLECADVLGVGATLVAVGEHNVEHVRLAQSIVDTLSREWGARFPRPAPLAEGSVNVVGLDGNAKMSKSLGNTVHLRASAAEVTEAVSRLSMTDTGGRCVPARLLAGLGDTEGASEIEQRFQAGRLAPDDARHHVHLILERILEPMRERRAAIQESGLDVQEILARGAERARLLTSSTLERLRATLSLGRTGV